MSAEVTPRRRRHRDDRGDSLIEVLIAVVIIALAAGPLIGALLESIAASAEHRGLATADTLLKSFAETAVSEIQTSPLPGTAYQATTSPSYRLLSNPSKMSGPAGTTVTVFVTGFPSTSTFAVSVDGKPATLDGVTAYTGGARLTFAVPGTLAPSTSPYPITVSAGGSSAVSLPGTGFQVTTGSSGTTATKTPYRAYEIEVTSVKCWTPTTSSFGACSSANDASGLQLVTFSAKGSSGTLGTLGVVVRDPSHT
jgi:prepilin-type N-terminal cleavage/methylation domain-containing protein